MSESPKVANAAYRIEMDTVSSDRFVDMCVRFKENRGLLVVFWNMAATLWEKRDELIAEALMEATKAGSIHRPVEGEWIGLAADVIRDVFLKGIDDDLIEAIYQRDLEQTVEGYVSRKISPSQG